MKQFRLLLTILTLLAVGSMNTWAETITLSSFTAKSASMDANISYSTAQGGGTAAPKIADNTIYLYQNSKGTGGGTITITAAEECTIQSVTIGSSMATKVAYTLDASTTKSTTTSVTANGTFTASDLSASSITFYCMGKDKNSRLYVNYLSVTYSSSKTNVSVNQTLTGVKEKEGNPISVEKTAEEVTFYYEAETGYELPDATGVSVKIGTTTLTENDDYTWTKETGELWIASLYNAFSDDINITITGVKKAAQKLTLKWSENGKTKTTQIDEGSAIGTLPADPSAPSGCSDKVFVGWTATNIGATPTNNKPDFITANTVPAGNTTYYAVFAIESIGATPTKFAVGDVGNYAIVAYNDNAPYALPTNPTVNSGKIKALPITVSETNGVKYIATSDAEGFTWTIAKATSGYTIFDGAKYIYHSKGGSDGTDLAYGADGTTYTWSFTADGNYIKMAAINGTTTNNRGMLFNGTTIGGYSLSNWNSYNKTMILPIGGGTIYKEYVSECINCTDPATPLTLNIADAEGTTKDADGNATINIGQDGNAVVTFSATGGNGAAVTYAVTPTTGATLNGTTVTFTQEGTFTLTASQTYTTTNGTTYCGGTDSKKIVITKTPTLYFTTIPADPIEFGTVECGGNTPLENKQSISLRGYNLIGDVTVTVTGDYKIADTESAAWEDYATSLTLQKDAVSGSSASVYVISTPPMQSSEPTMGKVTFATAGGNTLEVNLSTPDITCTEYTLTFKDRGTTYATKNLYVGAELAQSAFPADPTGVCTEPINYIFDGWATAEVAEGSTTYTKVPFPYTMPAANTTLYAVYKYSTTISNDYQKITDQASLTDGEYLVVGYRSSTYEALSSIEGSTDGQYKAVAVTPTSDVITTDDETLIWNVSVANGKYTIAQGGQYLNINNSVMVLESTAIPYTLTVSSGVFTFTTTDSKSSSTTKISYYANNSVFNAYRNANTIYLYRRQQDTYYTTAPSCTPCIKGTDDITVTSAKGVWVEAVTPLNITATNLDKNADEANVTITATSLTDGFTLKTQEANDSDKKSVTLVTGYSNSTYNANLTVVYSPTADNIIEKGKIALRVCSTDGTTTYATDTVIVRGRSLPAEFVLAAKTASGWVALPADLGTSSTDAVKKPYTISVDDDAAPTKATLVPQSALYSAAMRSAANTIPTGLRFKAGERYLQGSTSTTTTNVWLSSDNSVQMQSWELHSSDLTDYFVRLRAAAEGRYLSYNATQGKIANYKQESRLRILPVENTCVRYDAPNISVHALISTSVTFVWEAIAGVTGYEYSLDNEQTWQVCGDIETLGTEVKWTLANLNSETKYTVYIRAKVADGKSNCSASDSETFTTPTCDDVPVDLWVSPTANAATIMWSANAPTATVKIYADEQGNTVVKETSNATTPCKITGLEQNTNYYYQVLADGSCASAIAHFKTESNEVSIVEWKKDALIVDLNTEVTDADEVSILVEGQKTHGTNNNVADDLFFSKYYEASGNVKLVAIYNGTKDTLPLTNVKIKLGITSWDTKEISMAEYGEYKRGHIAPDEEIILWYYKEKDATDEKIVSCVKNKINIDILNKESNVSFSGRQTLALVRGSEIIDIMGAINIKDTNVDNVKPITGNCEPSWGDIEENRTWCGTGYSLDDPTQEIELSMNRCLLVRSNKVTSGDSAVINNVGAFKTFTKGEWLGRQVTKGDDNGVTESCNGFAYVADFNYNDYYTTYDSIANLEIKGNRNEDGTYTIPILKLDTMACTNLRLQLKKKGTIQATREEKVPIIVNQNTNTEDPAFFGGKLTDEICKTCDVVVRDNAQLLHTAGGKQQFRDMYVYTGSSLNIPENQTMSLDKVRMFATNDSVSYAIVNNSNDAAAAISVKEVSHVKRIDGRYWYPFSLPYDCNIADIDQLNGQPLGVYGMDWGIKYYDGQRRQSDGNSTTHYGEVSKYWTMMPANGTLKAYTGYIIGLFVPAADEPLMKSVNFPPATESAYTEDASSKTTPITNWPDNLSAKPRHHGWNFTGSPYISLFGAGNEGEGLYNAQLTMGWTDALGNRQDEEHIYVSIPDGGNSNTYTQALASGVTIKPFTAYFVQAIDPTDGQSPLNLTYSKGPRSLPKWAPARTAKTDALILTELDIANGALGDNTGVLVSNVYSAEYEIGDDLTKMYAAAQKPQLYTIDAHNDKMAYQALPDVLAHAIPLGIYVPQAGNYTLSLNRYVSRLEAAEAVYLLHNGAVVANLLQSDYTVSASAKGTISGYSLDIRRAPEVVTDIVPAAGDAPYIIARDGVLAIANLPADAIVQVYDVLGHQLLRADTPASATLQVPVPQTGVYTVVITTANGQQVLKTLLR